MSVGIKIPRNKKGEKVPRKLPPEFIARRWVKGGVANPTGKSGMTKRVGSPSFNFTELAKRVGAEIADYRDPNAICKLEELVRTVWKKALEGDRCCLVELLSRIDPPPKGDRAEHATKVVVNMITEGAVKIVREGLQESLDAVVTPGLLSQETIEVEPDSGDDVDA